MPGKSEVERVKSIIEGRRTVRDDNYLAALLELEKRIAEAEKRIAALERLGFQLEEIH